MQEDLVGTVTAPRLTRKRQRLTTSEKIIQAAGRVFAERGYQGATGKEICERAEVSLTAINYHFGGMEALYHQVLTEAYDQLVAFDAFADAMQSEAEPEQRLKALFEAMIGHLVQPVDHSWQLRVISREAMSPSVELDRLRNDHLIPKMRMLRELVSEFLGLPPEHPTVVQGCLSIMAPLVLLQVGDWSAIDRAFHGFHVDQGNAADLARYFYTFTLGGLRAVAAGQAGS